MSKSSSSNNLVKQAALDYISKGWAPIPIPYRSKNPGRDDWEKLRISAADVDKHFGNKQSNIGIHLGAASGGLVDVDCDWPETVQLAPHFLPDTLTFGRPGNPKSHYLFQVDQSPEKKAWTCGKNDKPIVELRTSGHQTVFPPSTHESGEPITWTNGFAQLLVCAASDLKETLDVLATAAVMLRHWPRGPGQRDDLAMAYAGMLLRFGKMTVEQVEKIILQVAKAAGDEEADKRAAKVQRTKDKLDAGGLATGRPTLAKIIGDEPADAIANWLSPPGQHLIVIDELNAKHAVVRDQGKTRVYNKEFDPVMERWVYSSSTFTDFTQFYMTDLIQVGTRRNNQPAFKSKADIWLESKLRRRYEGIVFDPDDREHPNLLNTFQGWGVEPVQGDWSLLQQHTHENLCGSNQEYTDYFLNWLAFGVQFPTKLPEVALVMRGKKGTGKGVLARAYKKLFGQHGWYVTNAKHLTGQFNAHLRDCVFLYADEAFWAGDKQGEGILQTIITEDTLPIEDKYRKAENCRNLLHIIMTTNADWVVPASMDERRFFVVDVSDCHMRDFPYFKAIGDQMSSGGSEAMFFDLLHRDLTGFEPRRVPNTAALLDQKLLSMKAHEKWWYQKLQEGRLTENHDWSGEVTWVRSDLIYDDYVRVVGKSGVARRSVETELGTQIKKLLPKGYPDPTRMTCEIEFQYPDGSMGTKTDRRQHWSFPALLVCRMHFEKLIEAKIVWTKVRGNEI